MNGTGNKVLGQAGPLNPQLIHRVLLTEPSQFSSLTVSLKAHVNNTPMFEDFCDALKPSSNQSVEDTIKRAYRDKVCDDVSTTRSIQSLQQLLLELHQVLRSLIPTRTDLHSMLKDDEVQKTTSPEQLLPFVVEAGEALSQLESELRSESTEKWVQKAQGLGTMDEKTAIEFLVTSMLYLMMKAEMCDRDKQDFFLAHVWAPRIHNQGRDFERQAFQARFGTFEDKSTAPLTRQWLQELVSQNNCDELLQSVEAREALVKKGWIQDILFRGPERPSLCMPEIFALDIDQLRSIRVVTKSAAAGSVLALHACSAAGISTSALEEPLEASSALEMRRAGIAEAMAFTTDSRYEENVANAVVRLAKEWNPLLGSDAETALRNRTSSVLRAEDPVIHLLDSRMKQVFTSLMEWKPSYVEMQSGRATQDFSRPGTNAFHAAAMKAFCKSGLSFYASDLASVSYLAKKVADLAWTVYGDCLLNKMILDACRSDDP